ncbi:hypothetical protein PTE30175_02601 [Pandoraea terrae]|uniref:Lipoprotein n=1 Tax=Pandoraea terrae TaxID=1537710 RepID=A0A5E4VHX5_9BURK|nr:hypothetical protein [Pandoraea terrae]VVE11791.1 hypothetical protein PTE30175_02601 [Pandoraea terrae]
MKRLFILMRVGIGACIGSALTGCYTSTPQWDAQFGNAVTQVRAMQTLNPGASQDRDPVLGIDGKAGNEAMNQYDKSFRSPSGDANAYVIGVGTGGSGGGSR